MTTKLDKSYLEFIDDLKNQIKTARIKAHLAVNSELILLYFKIGKAILEKQQEEGCGDFKEKELEDHLTQNIKPTSRSRFSIFVYFYAQLCAPRIAANACVSPRYTE